MTKSNNPNNIIGKSQNPDLTLDRIRFLIERYYCGETTPEQEKQLYEFFSSRNHLTLPPDLRAEADVFCIVPILGTQCPDEKLLRDVESAILKEQKKTRLSPIKLWIISTAACLVIVFVLGLVFLSGKDSPSDISGNTTELTAQTRTDSLIERYVTERPHTEAPVNAQAPSTSSNLASLQRKASEAARRSLAQPNHTVREVTDSAEAVAYLKQINDLMTNAYAQNTSLQRKINSQMQDATELVSSYINNPAE